MQDKITKNKNVKLVFDGLSGVGKTTIIQKLCNKYKNLTWYTGDVVVQDEILDFEENIKAFHKSINLIENSLIQSYLVKQALTNYGIIDIHTFYEIQELFDKYVKDSQAYLHIYLVRGVASIDKNRKERGRKFEYSKDFKFQSELDWFLYNSMMHYYKQYGINYLLFHLDKEDDTKKLENFLDKLLSN